MAQAVYKFTDSTSITAGHDIHSVMNGIHATLAAIEDDVTTLMGGWSASEADMYKEIITQWREGAKQLSDVLDDVRQSLDGMREGNTALREAISKVLAETT